MIRGVYPRTLNLGISGIGSLTQLAILAEYVSGLAPQAVLWLYYEGNDLQDQDNESAYFPFLMNYLTPGFRQGLTDHQTAIDQGLKVNIERELFDKGSEAREKRSIRRIVTLWNLRVKINKWARGNNGQTCGVSRGSMDLFNQILTEARDIVVGRGGELYFVYLPRWSRYADSNERCGAGNNAANLELHNQVVSMAQDTGLKVIDITKAFDAQADPTSLWWFGVDGHYNEDGYKLIAETVLRELRSSNRTND